MTPERKERMQSVLNYRQPDMAVVIENVEDPHNVSAVMRSCDAVGIQHIYILNTQIAKHKKYGHKSSGSAARWLTVHEYDDVEACFDVLKKKYKVYATHLSANAVSVYDMNFAEPLALVFGNEITGITKEVLALCDGNFIIPQVGMVKSLNISVACAVTLYEAFRQRQIADLYNGEVGLPLAEKSKLAEKWRFVNRKNSP